ncbi:hypothetical protein AAFN86_28210 [Roseomonas sp. CAU 1739]|uniref:hypothetical protein n=1 Tax=Roseomonas sp. CAU 1739 TaxID=3140364 RepID=UPI00325B400A
MDNPAATALLLPPIALPALIPISQSKPITGIARSTAYRLGAEGKLDLRKIGATTYITADSLRALIASLPIAKVAA